MENDFFRDYPDIVTVEQLCGMLYIGRNTAYNLLKSKQIRHLKVGSNYRIPKAWVINYVIRNGQ